MKFSNIMIVTDLDGTFYNTKSKLVPKNMEAVEYFKTNGGLFTYASGRVPNSFYKFSDDLKNLANTPTILCNGGFCYDFATDTRLSEVELDYGRAAAIIDAVRGKFPDMGIRCSLRDGEFWLKPGERIENHCGTYKILGDSDKVMRGFTRVSFEGDAAVVDMIRELIEADNTDCFAFMKACPSIFEFQDIRATKGLALDRLRESLIRSGRADNALRVYAVGDYENDLDLLRHADVACCPANAIDSVKAVSSVHLCHCDEGCAAELISRIESGDI